MSTKMHHRVSPSTLGALFVVATATMSAPVFAQDAEPSTGFRAEMFNPVAVQHTGILNLRRPAVLKHLSFGGGIFAHFEEDPVSTADLTNSELTGTAVDRQITTELGLGIGLFDVLQINVAAPVFSAQWGRQMPDAEDGGFPFGDLRLAADFLIVDPDRANGFGVSATAGLRLPTGTKGDLTGDDELRFTPSIALGKRWPAGHEIVVNAGVQIGNANSVPRFAYTDAGTLLGGVGGALNLGGSDFDLIGSLYGQYSVVDDLLGPDGTTRVENKARAFEGLGGVRWHLPLNIIAQAGAGAQLNDGLPAPDFRVFTSVHWAWDRPEAEPEPEPEPEPVVEPEPEPEPEPAPEPEPIPEPEPVPEPEPEPEPEPPKIVEHKIEFSERILFETGKADLRPESNGILTKIANVVKEYPQISKIQIEGHTDSVGKDAANKKLSKARAESVKKFMVGQGLDGSKFVAVGFGEERPIASNDTPEGQAKNRRVEFVILEVDGKPVKEGEAIIKETVPAE